MLPIHSEQYTLLVPLYYPVVPTWYHYPSSSPSQPYSPIYPLTGVPHTQSSSASRASKSARPSHHIRSHELRSAPTSPAGPPKAPLLKNIPLPPDDTQMSKHDASLYTVGEASSPTNMRPIIDPLLTIPRQNAEPHISWDLTQHPSAAFRNYHLTPDALLRPCAVYSSRRAGRLPLKSLVLILPHLPVEIKIPSLRASSRVPSSYATVWDVLEGLYHGLQTPVGSKELQSLSPSQRATLVDASKLRRPCVPEDETWGHVVRWIDYLSHRRRFLGIRPAMFDELPPGRTLGEVFVVEVGAVW